MSAPREILELVARFGQQLDAYKSGQYNETQVRREFLDPFFKALGWDVDNTAGNAEAYKDVIHEDQVRVGGVLKAPDYSFRIGGNRKYFLEAKKPSVVIKDEPAPAFQLRRYAWSAKLPMSILSDFEELAVYDGRVKPNKNDSASTARIFYCTFRDYAEKWDWIYERFCREAVLKGAFDKFAEATKTKRGTTEVDAAFLETIEGWRKELAQNLALRNARLSQRELNFAVQRIIDRIIFLRICEDRGIEDYGRLQALINGDRIYPRLVKLFEQADDRYNSGLFHFKKEPGRNEAPDELTLDLDVDDKLLRGLLRDLYYPDSPYEFSVLSADILGQVYEQFLGKVIRLTDGHRAVVDDKPEVKKAGGVYYTPTYIVDYIVKQTVGKLVDECSSRRKEAPSEKSKIRNPKSVIEVSLLTSAATEKVDSRTATAILSRVSKLRVLDPACGSGSFLLGAYQFLLDWHLQFYLAGDPPKFSKGNRPALVQTGRGWKLTIAERKRILLANIYGVDIDAQAVEVTKLSLLLKVLEGETGQTLQTIFRLFSERALPDLGDNIKCGNSLIGPDFYQQGELSLLTDEEKYRINVFDWQAEFADIFKIGGFDAVIGNPPYDVMEKERGKSSWPHELLADYAKKKDGYGPALGGKLNLFRFFIVRSLQLVREQGRVGMIVPMAILADISCAITRRHLLLNTGQLQADCFPQKDNANRRVFKLAKLSTMIFSGSRVKAVTPKHAKVRVRVFPWNSFGDKCREAVVRFADVSLLDPENLPIPLVDESQWKLCIQIHRAKRCKRLGEAPDFNVTRGEINQTIYADYITEDRRMARLLKGVEIGRFRQNQELKQGIREWFDERRFLAENSSKKIVHKRRIATQRITGVDERLRVVATVIDPPTYFADSTNSITVSEDSAYKLEYVVGLLNSTLFQWRFKLTSTNNNVGTNELETLPFAQIDFSDKSDKAAHDRMVKLVDQMLELHQQLAAARTPQEQTALERQIAATDTQIDRLVYDLYGLTEDEIKIVEGKADAAPAPDSSELVEPSAKTKRVRKQSVYTQPLPASASPESEAAAAVFHNIMGKEETTPYEPGDKS